LGLLHAGFWSQNIKQSYLACSMLTPVATSIKSLANYENNNTMLMM